MKKVSSILITFLCCIAMIFLMAGITANGNAVYIPKSLEVDPSVDYMAKMVQASEDGSEWALAMGRVYELLRNAKIDSLNLDYEKTNFFKSSDLTMIRNNIKTYLTPKREPKPEIEMIYMGTYWITGYDICWECCGKTDGITASGSYATVGRTVAAGQEFSFGTKIFIEGIGERIVEDRGGGITNGEIDVLCSDHSECNIITGWRDVWLVVG